MILDMSLIAGRQLRSVNNLEKEAMASTYKVFQYYYAYIFTQVSFKQDKILFSKTKYILYILHSCGFLA